MRRVITTDNFADFAKQIHGHIYDYSRVNYINIETHVEIGCPEHSYFWQRPSVHLNLKNPRGCKYCSWDKLSNARTIGLDEFIERAKCIHGDTYDYDLVEYVSAHHKIDIKCNICDFIFRNSPNNHIRGKQGCPICNAPRKHTLETFLYKIAVTHPYYENYDYSKVEFNEQNTKVKIYCKIHQRYFHQTPKNHLRLHGCPTCGQEKSGFNQRNTTDEFITKSIAKHGKDTWLYHNTVYTRSGDYIIVTCPKHDDINILAEEHLRGNQCKKCARESKRLTTAQFVERSNIIHGEGRFDYSDVRCSGIQQKVSIICHKHSEPFVFLQAPSHHIYREQGCPRCNQSHGERKIRRILESNTIDYETQVWFDDCRGDSRPLKFDFYLPDHNTLIEYDGKQHYEPIDYYGGEKAFKKRQRYDQIKTDYCLDNDITLIRIRYDDDVNAVMSAYF